MNLSSAGLQFIRNFERFIPAPYQDQGGVWTIGFGATRGFEDERITVDTPPIDEATAEKLLARDTGWAEHAVNVSVKRPLAQHEFDALTSLVYNIGSGEFHTSKLLPLVIAGRDVSKEWMKWVFVKGRRSAGLLRRRTAELNIYTGTIRI